MGEASHPSVRCVRWWVVGVLSVGHFTNDFYALYLAALLPTLTERFGLTGPEKGLLAAMFSVSASLSQPLLGWLSEGRQRRGIVVGGMAVAAVLLSLLAHAPELWLVAVLAVVGGLGVAVYHPNSGLLVREASGGSGLAMAIFISCGGLGVFAAPIFVRWCADEGRLDLLPWSMVMGLTMAGLMAATPLARAGSPAVERPRLRELLARAHRPLHLLLVVGLLRALTYGTFNNFLLFYGRAWGWRAAEQRLMLGAFLLSAALGGLVGGMLSDRIGRRRMIAWPSLVAGLMLTMAVQDKPFVAGFWLVVGGIALGASTPVCVVAAQEIAPRHAAAATGMMAGFAWGLGSLLLPGIGAIEDAAGPGAALLTGAGASCLAGLLALALSEPNSPRLTHTPTDVTMKGA